MQTQKRTYSLTGRVMEAGETLYEIAELSAAATVDLHPKDRESKLNSLVEILHCLGTTYRLGCERYGQRRQLVEMDDRQLKDIGITREQAQQEAAKPIWKD